MLAHKTSPGASDVFHNYRGAAGEEVYFLCVNCVEIMQILPQPGAFYSNCIADHHRSFTLFKRQVSQSIQTGDPVSGHQPVFIREPVPYFSAKALTRKTAICARVTCWFGQKLPPPQPAVTPSSANCSIQFAAKEPTGTSPKVPTAAGGV